MKTRTNYYIIFIILAVAFQAMSGICSKYIAMSQDTNQLFIIVQNAFYWASIGCLILQALVWQQALKHYDLTFAYPFLSLVNFVILISSYFLFNEGVTMTNVIGLVLISIGVLYLSRDGAST